MQLPNSNAKVRVRVRGGRVSGRLAIELYATTVTFTGMVTDMAPLIGLGLG